jgi:hypothetical protein
MVGADVRGAALGAPDVHADERHFARHEVGDQCVIAVYADENSGIEAMLEADIVWVEQQRVIARLREPSRDRGEHLREEHKRQVAVARVVSDDNGDEPCLLSRK